MTSNILIILPHLAHSGIPNTTEPKDSLEIQPIITTQPGSIDDMHTNPTPIKIVKKKSSRILSRKAREDCLAAIQFITGTGLYISGVGCGAGAIITSLAFKHYIAARLGSGLMAGAGTSLVIRGALWCDGEDDDDLDKNNYYPALKQNPYTCGVEALATALTTGLTVGIVGSFSSMASTIATPVQGLFAPILGALCWSCYHKPPQCIACCRKAESDLSNSD